jgi:hypothetical protein
MMLYKLSLKREIWIVSVIILLALSLRVYLSFNSYCTSSDEYCNIWLTRNTFESGFKNYSHVFMWLYFFISALLLFILNDALLTTKIVTIFFGTFLLVIAYLVSKRIFGRKVALLASFLLLINPEFALVSSVPLREPVYAFFVFLSLLFASQQRIFCGAFSVAFAFLTRMEGLLIDMPYYLAAVYSQSVSKKHLKLLIVVMVFVLAVLFMNHWVSRPFGYLTDTFGLHAVEDPQMFIFEYSTPLQTASRIWQVVIKLSQYLLTLIGPNIFFLACGLYFLLKDKIKECRTARIFAICFLAHFLFWVIYIFIFGKVLWDNYRYLYPLIPLGIIVCSYGFFKMYEIRIIRYPVIALLIANVILGYFLYYHNYGKRYLEINESNKSLVMASDWIKCGILRDKAQNILIDGAAFFYLSRYPENLDNTIRWEELKTKLKSNNSVDSLFGFMEQNNIKYVVWQNDNDCSVAIAPYLDKFITVKNSSGVLVPIRKFDGPVFRALIYEFKRT